MMTNLGEICSAALKQYLAHGESRGLNVDSALSRAGLSPTDVADPEARIPGESFQVLLRELISQSGDPLFGLHTSQFVQPGSYNVMGYIAMSAGTIFEALSKVALYERLVGDMGTTDTQFEGERAVIHWRCRYTEQPVRRHLIENVLGSWLRYTRWLAGNANLSPEEVWFEHPLPEQLPSSAPYEALFGCQVRFQQPVSAIVGPRELLNHRLRQPDPLLLSTLEAHAAQRLADLGVATTLSEQVRQCIRDALGHYLPRKNQVAEQLGMNVRTMHRRLAQEGHSWQELLDQVRFSLAKQKLRLTQAPQADIAHALGYSDIRSFQRSFKRNSGQTPGQFRRQHS